MTIPSIYSKVKEATVALAVLKEGDPQRPFAIVGSGFCVDLSGIVITVPSARALGLYDKTDPSADR